MNTQLLFEYMKKYNLTKTAFAKLCGISLCKLNNALKGSGKVKVTTLIKIMNAMNVSAQELLNI